MSTENLPAQRNEVKRLEVKEAQEIAEYYGAPISLVNLYWCDFAGVAYPKIAFLLDRAHKRGIQRIELVRTQNNPDEWVTECRIYPAVKPEVITALSHISNPDERQKYWDYLTQPTIEWGKASKETVRMSTMQKFLPEMSIKRALARACKLFAGIGSTAYEELPEAEISEDEAADARKLAEKARPVGRKAPENEKLIVA